MCFRAKPNDFITLSFFFPTQLTKGQRYRFSLIINELKNAEVVPYMTTCLAFINTILIATEDFEERVRLRNEFAGEGLVPKSFLLEFKTADLIGFPLFDSIQSNRAFTEPLVPRVPGPAD